MDEEFILTIMEKFNGGVIAELELSDGTTHLVLRKGHTGGTFPAGSAAAATSPAEGGVSPESPVHLGISSNAAENSGGGEKITSPIVATFYSSPGPDSPPFVKSGAKVKAGQTLCILEAMKMMNHLEAEFDCEIIESHAANGELVEYGQILFTVKKL